MIDSDGLYEWPESMCQDEPEHENIISWFRYNPFAEAPEGDYDRVPESLIERELKKAVPHSFIGSYQIEFIYLGLIDIIRNEQRADLTTLSSFADLEKINPSAYLSMQKYLWSNFSILN